MNNDKLVQMLILLAGIIVCIIVVLIMALFVINAKEKRKRKKEESKNESEKQVKKSQVIYTAESILDFMEFEKIEDNMIIQKNGKFLMVVECKGINYDLMSDMEKISVEQGFVSFLNTLRHPIQIYIQARTVNLEKSIDVYKSKLKEIERKYEEISNQYEKALSGEINSKNNIDKIRYELVKQRNLKEYTADIIKDIERQSLNKSILSKKYYIIIPCYQSELVAGDFDKTEIKNMAFSELYTRARSIINALFTCQVNGKVLNSEELVDLLYMAYNRDEADLFWLDKMKKAGYDELYSTAPDVIDKKLKMLDKQIEDAAIEKANKKISEVKSEKELEVIDKEENTEKHIDDKAKELIQKHKRYIGKDIAERAIEKIDQKDTKEKKKKMQTEKNEEVSKNANVQEKDTRRRTTKKVE